MKFKILSGFIALGALIVGCGDDSGTGASGGGGAAQGGEAQGGNDGNGGMPVLVGGGGAGGMTTGDGNDDIDHATPMEDMNGAQVGSGDLTTPDLDVDFYSFTFTAGPVLIFTDAKPDDDPFADGFLDTVITLFDSAGNQIAQNDDPFPQHTQDSELYTILPEDGTYFIKVEEFCAFDPTNCDAAYFEGLTELTYTAFVVPLDPSDDSTVEEAGEPNDTAATATPMEYLVNTAGVYYLSAAYGDLSPAGDVDGIKFTIPNDITIDTGHRPNAQFVLPPPGIDGNGSSINPGLLTVQLGDENGAILAQLDLSDRSNDVLTRRHLEFPVTLGATYFLSMDEGTSTTGSAPFYFALHGAFDGDQTEAAELTNNLPATPEALTEVALGGGPGYRIQGNLATADVDYFTGVVTNDVMGVFCDSATNGSGVVGFKVSAFKADGITPIAGTSTASEGPGEGDAATLSGLDVSAEANVVLKVEKTGQSATNTGDYYTCAVVFAAP